MVVAMYDVKKCRSICCHKSLSERLVLQYLWIVVVVRGLCFGGVVMSPT